MFESIVDPKSVFKRLPAAPVRALRTSFANNINPFTGEKVPMPAEISKEPARHVAAAPKKSRPAKKRRPSVRVEDLVLGSDPLPTVRQNFTYKYDEKFSRMKFGSSLKCPQAYVSSTASALRAYLKRQGKTGVVKSCEQYENDPVNGRIWLLEK